jgi:hypothetical protein
VFPVIWHRWGILVLVFIITSLFATQAIVDWRLGHGFYTANFWPKATAFAAAAVATGVVGYFLNRKHETWATKHRFFFLPMEYWALVIFVITALITFGEYRNG